VLLTVPFIRPYIGASRQPLGTGRCGRLGRAPRWFKVAAAAVCTVLTVASALSRELDERISAYVREIFILNTDVWFNHNGDGLRLWAPRDDTGEFWPFTRYDPFAGKCVDSSGNTGKCGAPIIVLREKEKGTS